MKFSPSLVKTWMRCPLQAKFRYVDGIPDDSRSGPAEFGTAVHAALEHYNQHGSKGAAEELFERLWEEVIADPEVDMPPRTSFASYRDKGLKMIAEYVESRKWATDVVIAYEHRYCVPFGDHELSGIVDMLSVDEGNRTVNVVDYKTGKKPNTDNLNLDIQFTAYLYATTCREFWTGVDGSDKYVGLPNGDKLYEKYKDFEKVGFWLDLRNAKSYNVGQRGEADLVRLYRCLDQIEKAMELEVFVPDISGDTCKYCAYQEQCPSYLMPDQTGKDLAVE